MDKFWELLARLLADALREPIRQIIKEEMDNVTTAAQTQINGLTDAVVAQVKTEIAGIETAAAVPLKRVEDAVSRIEAALSKVGSVKDGLTDLFKIGK
jgi:hypothetical protein